MLYDGKNVGPDSFEGKLGKEARAQNFLEKPVVNFKTIKSSLTVVREDLSDKNLSKDQSLMLDYALAIITGKLEKKTANRMIGAIVHSRWCNLATSLMENYTVFQIQKNGAKAFFEPGGSNKAPRESYGYTR